MGSAKGDPPRAASRTRSLNAPAHRTPGRFWRAEFRAIGQSPRVPNNWMFSGAVHGQLPGLCSEVVSPLITWANYRG